MPLPTRNYPRSKLIPELPTSLQFYSTAEVAIILETNVKVIYAWIEEGLMPSVQFGNEKHMIRIRAQDLEKFIDAHLRNGLIKPAEPKRVGDK